MKRCICMLTLLLAGGPTARAHELGHSPPVVIDTDLGLDDVVALSMALQHPRLHIEAIVFTEGVAGRKVGIENLERLLDTFNRPDVAVYAPADGPERPAPPFREFAEATIRRALPNAVSPSRRPFIPEAYTSERGSTTVLVLGPLTNLAAALRTQPAVAGQIHTVIVAGEPDPESSWNARYDADALAAVRAGGLSIRFIAPGPGAAKPEAWKTGPLTLGDGTAPAEGFLDSLFAEDAGRRHYCERFGFHDELVILFLEDPDLFEATDTRAMVRPANPHLVSTLFTRLMTSGRQHKPRVVFADRPLPDNVFQADLRQRKGRIIARHGRDEWFAQLLMNELHEHLGAYSVIGVKMGLRAAELLNAPQHGMQVVSHSAAHPPVSCLNDGVIVATGCTPGRGLFRHQPGPNSSTRVTFAAGNRSVTLQLKDEYVQRVRARIAQFLAAHSLEDHAYWNGVRAFGLDIWEQWHRKDIFDVTVVPTP